jgi:hypothetical protein
MSDHVTSPVLELPPALLALLFQHVASGPGGLASAAALSQTCKLLHRLSEGSAVIYRNVVVAAGISSPANPVWQWLAKRVGRIAGLSLQLCVRVNGDDDAKGADQLPEWLPPLQTLSGISGVQLRVEWVDVVARADHPCITQWLKQHGQLIRHLTVEVLIKEDMLKLKDFSEAAAPCRSIDLTVNHSSSQVIDLADLCHVAASLQRLTCHPTGDWGPLPNLGILRGASVLGSMSQITALHLDREDICREDLTDQECWGLLAKLTSLQELRLHIGGSGDPSPLSALTGLSSLHLQSIVGLLADNQPPFSFSSLQPLSTLQKLEELHLDGHACGATSLHGLEGLNNLKSLGLVFYDNDGRLSSLAGLSPAVTDLSIYCAPDLVSLAGIEGCTSMKKLSLQCAGVSSLQPLRGLSSLKHLVLSQCRLRSLEGLNSMSMESLGLECCSSLRNLFGVEHISALKSLVVAYCGVTSLQELSQLGEGLRQLWIKGCWRVQKKVLELPHVQPTADVVVVGSSVNEVVLAGGLRRFGRPAVRY